MLRLRSTARLTSPGRGCVTRGAARGRACSTRFSEPTPNQVCRSVEQPIPSLQNWVYVIELGDQRAQVCQKPECGKRKDGRRFAPHFWIERKPLESCPKCGGELQELWVTN